MVEKITVTASRDTREEVKFKEEFGVDTKLIEGKNKDKRVTNDFVTAKVSGYAGFSSPIGRIHGNQLRRHLTPTLGTREGVGGQAEGTRRDEPSGSRVGESADAFSIGKFLG